MSDDAGNDNEVDIEWPTSGRQLMDFKLMEQIGETVTSRVFLAQQGKLSKRNVVAKIRSIKSADPQWLAQLHHVNIVPIYSLHEFNELQMVCMPYYGSTTFAHILQHRDVLLREWNSSGQRQKRTSAQLATAVQTLELPTDPAGDTPRQEHLPQSNEQPAFASYGEWLSEITSQLACGLAHAHAQSVLHGDIKPSNLLLTDEGTPMLLDFSLVRSSAPTPALRDERLRAAIPYMSREQLLAVRGTGKIDEQCDIFSFGVVLYQLISGELPFPVRQGPLESVLDESIVDRENASISWTEADKSISPGLMFIAEKCLQRDPKDRFGSAEELSIDAQRHAANRPLTTATNRSIPERIQKWRRRHPRLGSFASLTIAGTLLTVAAVFAIISNHRAHERADALEVYHGFQQEFPRMRERLSSVPGSVESPQQAYEDVVKTLEPFDWRQQGWTSESPFDMLPVDAEADAKQSLGELLFLTAELLLHSNQAISADDRLSAEEIAVFNRQAMECFEKSEVPVALLAQRAKILELLGQNDESASFARRAILIPDRGTAYENYLEGVRLYLAQSPADATNHLVASTQENPDDFASWLALGNCFWATRQFSEAEACYHRCLSLRPDAWIPVFNRGLVHIAQFQDELAEQDFRRVLEQEPKNQLAIHYLARTLFRQQRYTEAQGYLADLESHPNGLSIADLLLLARIETELGNPNEATNCRRQALEGNPVTVTDYVVQGTELMDTDVDEAARKFEQALSLAPYSYEALLNLSHIQANVHNEGAAAVESLDKLVERYPHDVPARVSRGIVLARLEKSVEAMGDAKRALELDDTPETHYQVSCIYARANVQQESVVLSLAFEHLRQSLVLQTHLDMAQTDPDLESLREDERFEKLIDAARILAGE